MSHGRPRATTTISIMPVLVLAVCLPMLGGCVTMDEAQTKLTQVTQSLSVFARKAQASTTSAIQSMADQLNDLYDQHDGFLSDLFGDPADSKESYEKLVQSCPEAIGPIKNAAEKTGISANYLLALARQESGCNSRAKSRTSSAAGMFQFVKQTWLIAVDDNGAKYGQAEMAAAIYKDKGGIARVKRSASERVILKKRFDADFSALMAAELARDNHAYLTRRRKRDLTATDLYMAHFLGAAGANKFLAALDNRPNSSAAQIFPSAAKVNQAIFYKSGSPRTVREVHSYFRRKIEAV